MASAGGGALPNPLEFLPARPHLRFFAACADPTPRGTERVKAYLAANPNLIRQSMEYIKERNKQYVLEMWTALHFAAAANNPETLEALLEAPGAQDLVNLQSVREMDYSYDSAGYRFPRGCTALHVVCLIPPWHKPNQEDQRRCIELLIDAGVDTALQTTEFLTDYQRGQLGWGPLKRGKTAAECIEGPLSAYIQTYLTQKQDEANVAPPFYNNSGALLSPPGRKYPFFKNFMNKRYPNLKNIPANQRAAVAAAANAQRTKNAATRSARSWASAKPGKESNAVQSILNGTPLPQEAVNSEVGIVMKEYESLLSSYVGEAYKTIGKNAVEAKRKNTKKIIEAAVRKGLNSNTRAAMINQLEDLWKAEEGGGGGGGGGARRRKTRKNRKSNKRRK